MSNQGHTMESSSMEQLKNEMLDVIREMEETGHNLAQQHPRYAKQGYSMVSQAEYLQRRCEEALYSISLVAAFQSGKSTTMNAMADGREICPRGNGGGGIRTSSCAVRVSCALDGVPGASVLWMSPEEQDTALRYALGLENSLLTLSDQENVAWAWEAAREQAEQMSENPLSFDERSRDQIKQALLILSFHDDVKAREYLGRSQFSEPEIRRFLSFSSDVIMCWNNVFQGAKSAKTPEAMRSLVKENFTVEQAMYVFINVVNYSTPSQYLRSLGVQVVDTPGLNMSDNDTRVALRAMQDSSAIFYFFTGSRQLDESDKQALRLISQSGMAGKVFFGINFRKPLASIRQIEATILADLDALGFRLPHQRTLLHYNAFLAQRAKQGRMILAGNLDEEGRAMILHEAELAGVDTDDVATAWLETTESVMYAVRADGYRDFRDKGLTEEAVDLVLAASHWEETMEAINNHVLHHRGIGLLVDGLSVPVRRVLGEVEGVLQNDEDLANQAAGQLSAQYDEALERYHTFTERTEKRLESVIDRSWDQAIACDFYDAVYDSACEEAAYTAAQEIQKESSVKRALGQTGVMLLNRARKLLKLGETKSQMELVTEGAIQRAYASAVEQKTIAWQEGLEDSPVFRTTIRDRVVGLNEDIRDIWSDLRMDENEALRRLRGQLESKLPQGKLKADYDRIQLTMRDYEQMLNTNGQLFNWVGKVVGGAGVGFGAAVGMTAIYLYILPADFILPGIAELALILGSAVLAVKLFINSRSKKFAQREVARLTQEITGALHESIRDPKLREQRIKALINEEDADSGVGLKFYRMFYQAAFSSALAACQTDLENSKREAEEAAAASQLERDQIAAQANQIRTEIIAPMRESMEALEQRVRQLNPAEG